MRLSLAFAFTALGLGFLFAPQATSDLAQAEVGPGLRMLLGLPHLALGLALLISRSVAGATVVLGLLVVALAVPCLPTVEDATMRQPALLTLALCLLAAGCQLRRRADASAWHDILENYANESHRADSRGAMP